MLNYSERHTKKKKEELGIKYKTLCWLLRMNSTLPNCNKLLLYKQVLRSIWSYSTQMWSCTKKSNLEIIQRFQDEGLNGTDGTKERFDIVSLLFIPHVAVFKKVLVGASNWKLVKTRATSFPRNVEAMRPLKLTEDSSRGPILLN